MATICPCPPHETPSTPVREPLTTLENLAESPNMSEITQQHQSEVKRGERFEFGKNWANFLRTLTDQKIDLAVASLQDYLGVQSLAGKSFIDIGSGSGLFSLAARKLGAKVRSFDYDPNAVALA